MNQAIQQRLQQLKDQLAYHNHQYYVLDNPSIPDADYDALFQQNRIRHILVRHEQAAVHGPAMDEGQRRPAAVGFDMQVHQWI